MTGTAADLRDEETADAAYALRIEGCPIVFVSSPHLADGTWLTEHPTVLESLQPPRFSHGTNPRTGAFSTSNVSFELEDIDDQIASLFASVRSDVELLEATLQAGSTAAPAALYLKHVGVEAISSAGARMLYPAIPNFSIGYHHTGDLQASSVYQPIAPVSANPYVWAGRRVALLRVFHNAPSAGSNKAGVNWTAPANSDVVWYGTLLDEGQVNGKTWTLDCSGVQSWLTRVIGQDTWTEGVAISDSTGGETLDGEDYIGCYFKGLNGVGTLPEYNYGEDALTTQPADGTLGALRTAVNASIAIAFADTGDDGAWADDGGFAGFNTVSHEFKVGWNNPAWTEGNLFYGTDAKIGVMGLVMHHKKWLQLGYDPEAQVSLEYDDDRWVWFSQVQDTVWFPDGSQAVPSGGYYLAEFVTAPTGWEPYAFVGPHDLQSRTYKPWFSGGAVTLSATLPYEIELGHFEGSGFLYLDGQHDAAPASDPDAPGTAYSIGDGVGEVDSTRLFIITGPRRVAGEEDAHVETQVVRCSWQDSSGAIAEGSASIQPRMVVHEILDPRLFGVDRDLLKADWVIRAGTSEEDDRVYIMPLTHVGAFDDHPDPIGQILQRLLLTSGTGTGWTGFYDSPESLDAGDNEPDNDEPNPQYIKDYETHAMGLAIPSSVVQPPSEWRKEESRLPNKLRKAKVAYVGQMSAEDVMLGIMQPLGLCFHLRGGKIGAFNPWDLLNPGDAAIEITAESYSAGDDPKRARPKQSLRIYSPIDSLHLGWDWDPLEGGTQYETIHHSIDVGRRYRGTQVEHKVEAHGLRIKTTADWGPELREHWKRGFDWWSRRHFKVKVRLQRAKAQYCWPGTIVRYTDNWVVSPDGTYGVTNHVGFVTSISYDCGREDADVELLVQDTGAEGFRFYSPVAKCFHYDPTNYVLYCHDDYYRVGYDHNDVAWFAEPSWSELGGSADIELLQYDGNTWTGGIYGEVDSVNAVEGASYIQLTGALTGGTFYSQKDTLVVLRERANQGAAWVIGLFAPIANEDGEVNGGTSQTVKFNGV